MRRSSACASAGMSVTTVADITRYQASRAPDAIALSFEGRQTTFGALDVTSNRVANGLIAAGIEPRRRVAILDKNTDIFFEVLLGSAKANAVLVPINARLAAPEIAFILNDAEAEVLFVGESLAATLAAIRDKLTTIKKVIVLDARYSKWRDAQSNLDPDLPSLPDDVCLQMYTSGTTGHPKGVQLTNSNLALASPTLFDAWGNWTAKDVLLIAMPLYHIAGAGAGIMGLLAGLKTIVFREFVPLEVLEIVERSRVTVAFLVPAMILALLSEKAIERTDLSSLRRVIYGASPIPLELLKRALRAFKHTGFVQVYGLTETAGIVTALSPEDHSLSNVEVMNSCGRAIDGVELRIVDPLGATLAPRQVGEVVCRTFKNMKGYWNRAADTTKTLTGEWLHTGDAGYLDENGYLYIHDRVKDMIVSGGENIYPAEIESALFSHPDIADIAVIGVPDERWGEAVKALVVLRQDRVADAGDILRYAREFLAGYKIPKSVEFLPELPRNAAGKILKRELREHYWRVHARRVN
jgi:acyl-CoA synthetase (AMP-forming)/AMP-acid ligase II